MSMSETIISFETAKLAKEKGFDITEYLTIDSERPKGLRSNYNPREQQTWFLNITQSLLQRWLREVHNIDVLITSVNGSKLTRYVSKIYVNKIWMKIVGHSVIYEYTFEKGLQEALKLIK